MDARAASIESFMAEKSMAPEFSESRVFSSTCELSGASEGAGATGIGTGAVEEIGVTVAAPSTSILTLKADERVSVVSS
jgi:hypothetical protein